MEANARRIFKTVFSENENRGRGEQKQLQERYDLHRRARNEQQKAKILDETFSGWVLDDYLVKLDGPQRDPDFVDPRNCLVLWARPPSKVRNLVEVIQQKLRHAAPGKKEKKKEEKKRKGGG